MFQPRAYLRTSLLTSEKEKSKHHLVSCVTAERIFNKCRVNEQMNEWLEDSL